MRVARAAALATGVPPDLASEAVAVEGETYARDRDFPRARLAVVTPEYFTVVGLGAADVRVVDGTIVAVGALTPEAGEKVIDAAGRWVAPGFIDLHAHGQSIPADRMQAFDGVTTSLDLEAGVLPVASWYKRQAEKGRVLNYGAAANWAFARIGAMTGSNAESSLEAFGNVVRNGNGGAFDLVTHAAFAFERFLFGQGVHADSEFDGCFPYRQIFKPFVSDWLIPFIAGWPAAD